jgi:phospholipid/cholesterol/gamma-HCH transport system substrate-binding protein
MRGTFRGHVITLVAALAFAAVFLIGLLTWSGNSPLSGGYKVSVMFPTAASMGPGASVRIAGIRVGRVDSVKRSGSAALLRLSITKGHTPLPEDTRAAVRLRTLVGENYVELIPGRSKNTVPDGGALPISQTDPYVEADEILSVLRGKTRDRARQMIQGFGAALDGQGVRLNSFFKHSSGALVAADDVTAILAKDHAQVASLVTDVGSLMRSIGDRSTAVKTLAKSGAQTFQALGDRNTSVKRLLAELPSTLRQVRTTSRLVSSVSTSSAPVVARLATAVDSLDPAIENLGPAAQQGRGILSALSSSAPGLTTTVKRLRGLAAPSAAALPQVRKVLCQLNPTAAYLKPYAKDIAALLTSMAGPTNFYDATGHAARFYAMAGQNSLTAIPSAGKDLLNKIEDIGLVNKLTARGYNPFPSPGSAPRPGGGEGLSGPTDVKTKYQRVEAEC